MEATARRASLMRDTLGLVGGTLPPKGGQSCGPRWEAIGIAYRGSGAARPSIIAPPGLPCVGGNWGGSVSSGIGGLVPLTDEIGCFTPVYAVGFNQRRKLPQPSS